MVIIGFRNVDFKGTDGGQVTGTSVYLAEPVPNGQGQGQSVDKIFLSSKKLAQLTSPLKVGAQVEVYYNKYGKVEKLVFFK